MKRELLKIAKDLDHEKISKNEARSLLLSLLNVVSGSETEDIFVSHNDDDVYCAFSDREIGRKDCEDSGTRMTKIKLYRKV